MRGLYIHIPFCHKLCSFCDFPKRINQKEEYKIKYVAKLSKEIEEALSKYTFDTIYIGGGTPNFLSNELLEEIFKSLSKTDLNAIKEFTIETNYEFITKEQAKLFKKYHVNRVSIGVQTLNKEIADEVNRYSDYEILKEKIDILKLAGIDNINLDFIFGLPKQTLADVEKDIELIKLINPKHISYYSLILEDKTVINHLLNKDLITLPEYELKDSMYELIIRELKAFGYHHYEISNFAKKGFESKHNIIYWDLDEYLGLGMGASSYIEGNRITNSRLIENYFENNDIIKEMIDNDTSKGEYFWLGLRKIDGVSISKYIEKYHSDPFEDFDIKSLIVKNLLEVSGDFIKLTKIGLEYGNHVFSYFV